MSEISSEGFKVIHLGHLGIVAAMINELGLIKLTNDYLSLKSMELL